MFAGFIFVLINVFLGFLSPLALILLMLIVPAIKAAEIFGIPKDDFGPDRSQKHLPLFKNIASAANGMDQLAPGAFIDLIAQIIDINVNDVRKGVEIDIPDMFNDHGAGEHPAGVGNQIFQQGIFLGGQLNAFAGAPPFIGKLLHRGDGSDDSHGEKVRQQRRAINAIVGPAT